MGQRKYRDIEIHGVVYPDANAAAAALGVTAGQVRMAVRRDYEKAERHARRQQAIDAWVARYAVQVGQP